MNKRHEQFVNEFIINGMNAAQAYAKVYRVKNVNTAKANGSRLLADADVARAIAEKVEQSGSSQDETATRVLQEMRRLAFSDMRAMFDPQGNLKAVKDWSEEDGAVVASTEVVIKNVAAGDGQTDTIYKLKRWDKLKALEMLAKYHGLLVERVEHTASDELLARLDAWKGRNRT